LFFFSIFFFNVGTFFFFCLKISLDPPIKQGQTRYHFLIWLFNKDEEMELDLGVTDEQLQEKFEGKLEKHMRGPSYELISKIMKNLLGRRITVPGTFTGHSGTNAISCAYKNANGFLYPLERGFIYVHKPPIHVRFEEIAAVNFGRSEVSTRSFDLEIETKAGTTYNFTSIEKEEYSRLYDFVTNKKVPIRNVGKKSEATTTTLEDFEGSSDEELDPYKERLKKEAEAQDESSSEEDSDYNPDEKGSEPDEEFDSEKSSGGSSGGSDGEGDEEKAAKKEKSAEAERSGKEAQSEIVGIRGIRGQFHRRFAAEKSEKGR